ncbi:hypothetical protein [Sulfurospirillum arcachonense]|uniref:hypothetical protein n=1 Tax=Sulfurospirillum arcachonense TaxID=57666 RepID=UPI000469AA6A|nr:hypothetical protein [Sulfurospirillum arcachonense]
MKIHEKYLETLKSFDDYVTVSEWAIGVSEKYPELLRNAESQVENHQNETTGLRAIGARLSARLSKGRFDGFVKIDDSEKPRKVKYISEDEFKEKENQDIEEDLEPINRREIEKKAEDKFALKELYRLDEFRNIQKSFKMFFNLDFELDHAKALLNKEDAGKHHPDNFQFILKYHNGKKSNSNWQRFTIDEQIIYIKKCIELQELVAKEMKLSLDENILDNLLSRLKAVY